jgi:bacteriochlorophyll 4-vinyl reductase
MAISTTTRSPELALPVAALAALRDALIAAVGSETASQALRQAGFAAGDALFRILAADDPDELGELPAQLFWPRLARLFAARGWGHLIYREAHAGVGALDATDWVEAVPESAATQPSCHFTTGMLANLLGRVVGAEVAVLEVECRSRGDQRCRFLFGGAAAVYALYERIAAGDAPDTALARLG